MNFEPVSQTAYARFNATAQILVCTDLEPPETARATWGTRAAAAFSMQWTDPLKPLVLDILANPQIRALVFVSEKVSPTIAILGKFWRGLTETKDWEISAVHLTLVRQFVDLYEGDCGIHGPLHAFWPERIRYGVPGRSTAEEDGGRDVARAGATERS